MPERAGVADVFGGCRESWRFRWLRLCRTPDASDLDGSTELDVTGASEDETQLARS